MQAFKLFQVLILLLLNNIKSDEIDCSNIVPKSSSDCILSEKEKSETGYFAYKYCCYELDSLGSYVKCTAYTESSYKLLKTDKSEPCYNETNPAPNDCQYISPEKSSDCVLSENDKKKYHYCCYKYYQGKKSCVGDLEEYYELNEELYKDTKEDVYDCHTSGNKSILINLSIISLLLMVLSLY